MRQFIYSCLSALALMLAGCSETVTIVGAERVLAGRFEAAPSTEPISSTVNAVLFLTRGGVFSSALIGEEGDFAVPIPRFTTTGALVIRQLVATQDGGQAIEVDAVLIDASGNGVIRIAGGEDDIELDGTLSVNLNDDFIEFDDPMDIPAELSFLSAPYSKADLCAYLSGSPSPNCEFSEAHGCSDGDADADPTCTETVLSGNDVLLECNPCLDMSDPEDFEGPFSIGDAAIGEGSIIDAAPLPQVRAPFSGLAVTGVFYSTPPSDFGGSQNPALALNLSAYPGLFLSDPGDPDSYRYIYESGARFSAEQLFSLTIPELVPGSGDRVSVTYYTTAGTLTSTLCACGDSAPQCRFPPGACEEDQ